MVDLDEVCGSLLLINNQSFVHASAHTTRFSNICFLTLCSLLLQTLCQTMRTLYPDGTLALL